MERLGRSDKLFFLAFLFLDRGGPTPFGSTKGNRPFPIKPYSGMPRSPRYPINKKFGKGTLQLQQTAAFEKETSLAQSSELDTELLNIFRQHIQARRPEIPVLRALESIQSSKMG